MIFLSMTEQPYLRAEKRRPNTVCTGMRTSRTVIPARQDGPTRNSSSSITARACRGPSHRKWRYRVTWKQRGGDPPRGNEKGHDTQGDPT